MTLKKIYVFLKDFLEKKDVETLISEAQGDIATELKNLKLFFDAHPKKMQLVLDLLKSNEKKSRLEKLKEIEEINNQLFLDRKLEQTAIEANQDAIAQVNKAIQSASDEKKKILKSLKVQLVWVVDLLTIVKSIVLFQVRITQWIRRNPTAKKWKWDKKVHDLTKLCVLEMFRLGYQEDGSEKVPAMQHLGKVMIELMGLLHDTRKDTHRYLGPVPKSEIKMIASSPLFDWWHHATPESKFAWDFCTASEVPIFATLDGTVIYSKNNGILEGNDQLTRIILEGNVHGFKDFIDNEANKDVIENLTEFEPKIKESLEDLQKAMKLILTTYTSHCNIIVIKHDEKTFSAYAHNLPGRRLVREGQKVKRGTTIAYVGNTGFSGGPHLHFEVFEPFDNFDPKQMIDGNRTEIQRSSVKIEFSEWIN